MESVEEAITYYTQRRAGSELSISEIRIELKKSTKFSDDEISKICREISDDELNQLQQTPKSFLGLFSSIYISYFLVVAFTVLLIAAIFGIQDLNARQAVGEVATSLVLWRYFLLAGSIFFLLRNVARVISDLKSRSN